MADADEPAPVLPLPQPHDERERALIKARLRTAMFDRDAEPTRVGRYALLKRLGAGGMGVVFRAYDERLKREVAVKLLHAATRENCDTRGRERLLLEAQAMARLQHPNVVPVFDAGEHDDAVFVAMELVEGRTLGEWLQAEERNWRAVLEMYVGAGRGLAAAHEAGIVHRDFKPANVIVGADGRPRVLDFGLARQGLVAEVEGGDGPDGVADGPSALTRTGAIVGTPAYMAPEQFEGGTVDARTDQFAFCVALYEAVFGKRPFTGRSVETLRETVTAGEVEDPPKGTKVPGRIRAAILRGLSRDPDRRFEDMGTLLRALQLPARRAATVVAASFVFGAGLLAFAASRAEPCAVEDAASLWTDARRGGIATAFEGVPPGDGVAQWVDVAPRIDALVGEWEAVRDRACEASDAPAHDRRTCVARHRDRIDVVIGLLGEGEQIVLESAVGLIAGLGDAEQCDGESPLSGIPSPPSEIAADIAALRRDIARGWAMHTAGDVAAAVEMATEAVDRARALGYRQVEAEALHLRFSAGHLAQTLPDDQAEILEKAALAAEISGDARLVATAAAHLLEVGPDDTHEMWESRARAALERIGGDPAIESILAWGKGAQAQNDGDFESALRLFERAEALAPPGDPLRTRSTIRIAENLATLRRFDESEAAFERGLKVLRRQLRPTHPRVLWALAAYATMLAKRGHTEQAVESSLATARLAESRYGATSREALNRLVNAAVFAGNVGLLERFHEIIAELADRTEGSDDPVVLEYRGVALHMAIVARFIGDGVDEREFIEVQEVLRACGRQCEGTTANNAEFYARFLVARGQTDRALHVLDERGDLSRRDASNQAVSACHEAFVLTLAGRPDDALAALDAHPSSALPEAGSVGEHELHRGLALLVAGRASEALPWLQRHVDNVHPLYSVFAAYGTGRALQAMGEDKVRADTLIAGARRDVANGQRNVLDRLDTLLAEPQARTAAPQGE